MVYTRPLEIARCIPHFALSPVFSFLMVFINGPGCILHSVSYILGTRLNILVPRSTEYSKMVDTSRNKREKEASGKIFDWHDLLVKVIRTHKLTVYLCSLWPGIWPGRGLAVHCIMSIYIMHLSMSSPRGGGWGLGNPQEFDRDAYPQGGDFDLTSCI